jgi:hypothetical protein
VRLKTFLEQANGRDAVAVRGATAAPMSERSPPYEPGERHTGSVSAKR